MKCSGLDRVDHLFSAASRAALKDDATVFRVSRNTRCARCDGCNCKSVGDGVCQGTDTRGAELLLYARGCMPAAVCLRLYAVSCMPAAVCRPVTCGRSVSPTTATRSHCASPSPSATALRNLQSSTAQQHSDRSLLPPTHNQRDDMRVDQTVLHHLFGPMGCLRVRASCVRMPIAVGESSVVLLTSPLHPY